MIGPAGAGIRFVYQAGWRSAIIIGCYSIIQPGSHGQLVADCKQVFFSNW